MNTTEEKQLKTEKKNPPFVQLYKQNITEIRWLINESPFASEVLFFIMEHMDHGNALAVSHQVLMDYFGKSRSTVSRAIKVLKDNGYIGVLKMGTANVYVVNFEVAWTSWDNRKEYCKFNGNMLVSRKENIDYYYKQHGFEKTKSIVSGKMKEK